uniref:BCLAF1 and THRAP3 family member 3 n=1 Tax=Astyanax mexicanus TaxID=7994 RepID=W5L3E8_ASTMX
MSQPHSRSPLYSRNATVPIKQEDGFYNERYSSVHSEPWRDPGNVNNLEGNSHWENGPSQGQQEVDHWAKFIEAIGHADRRRPSPPLRHHIQEDVRRSEEKSLHSPRRLPRERLSSPDALNYGAENHRRIASPGRGRNEHNVPHFNRNNSNKANWDSRDSSPRHLQGKRHDRVEHGYHSEEHEDRYHDRSSESHLGYSSERQLSLDLVNVGRQRLDFLPMLEHSGTFRESAMHSGTFAQEIITLVHHVKESFFQGQGITLNERFSCEQHYSLEDEDEFDDDIELEEMEPVINRPLGSSSSSTQIFCNLGSWQPDKRNVAAPGDLRHDLERRRQQRLQGVKITIAGGNFLQMAPQNQESEPVYEDEDKSEPVYEDVCGSGDQMGWSEQAPQQSEQWDDPFQEMPGPNFNGRQNFSQFHNTRPQPRRRRNPRGPNW